MGIIRMLVILLSFGVLAACGAKRTALPSSSEPDKAGNSDLVANCNEFALQGYTLEGGISAYDFFPNQKESELHLKIRNADSDYFESGDAKIEFRGWKLSLGQLQMDSEPIQFNLFVMMNGKLEKVNGLSLDFLKGTDLEKMIEFNPALWTPYGSNPQALLKALHFRLEGLPLNWKALQIQVSSDDGVLAQTDVLLPSFKADPVSYFAEQPHETLQAMHPLAGYINSSLSKESIQQYSHSLCSLFQ